MSRLGTFAQYMSASLPRWTGWVVGAIVTTSLFFVTTQLAPHYPVVLYIAIGLFVSGVLLSGGLLIHIASLSPDQAAFQEVIGRETATFLRRVNWLALGASGFYLGAVPLVEFVRTSPVIAGLVGLAGFVVACAVALGSGGVRRQPTVVFAAGERMAAPENLFHVRVSDVDVKRVAATQAARLMVGKPFVLAGRYRIRQNGQDAGVTFLLPDAVDSLPLLEWKLWSLYAGYVGEKLLVGAPSMLQAPEVRGAEKLLLQVMALRGNDPGLLAARSDRERMFLATRMSVERRRYIEEIEAFLRAERNLDVLRAIQRRLMTAGIPPHKSVASWMDHVTLTSNFPLANRTAKKSPAKVETLHKPAAPASQPSVVRRKA